MSSAAASCAGPEMLMLWCTLPLARPTLAAVSGRAALSRRSVSARVTVLT
jgi:hypothetical protein